MPFVHFPERPDTLTGEFAAAEYEKLMQRVAEAEAQLAHVDSGSALARYLELCRLGGTASVLQLFAAAGLRSPFDPELTRDLAEHTRSVLLGSQQRACRRA